MSENNENLQQNSEDVTLTDDGNKDVSVGAASSDAEDTPASGYEAIIAEQNKLIEALQQQLATSNDNLVKAIRQGAALTDEDSKQTPNVQKSQIGMLPKNETDLNEPYVPLKDLDFSFKKSDIL